VAAVAHLARRPVPSRALDRGTVARIAAAVPPWFPTCVSRRVQALRKQGKQMAVTGTYRGFTRGSIQFLADLALNNDRSWFTPRKADYERLVKEPLASLCGALAERFEARGIPLRADPVKSPFRIYRDVRFSADKSPYKTAAAASFPWVGEGGGVGAYFHFEPGDVMAGGGMWHPQPAQLAAWRNGIVDDWDAVRAAVENPGFVAAFGGLGMERGAVLKRVPPGFPADHPGADLLRLKDVVYGRQLSDDDLLGPDLPDILVDLYAASLPVLGLLARLGPAETRADWLRD
jgi:uncharacterized protein (TIGR02453 family)